jgi:hypothetical protein
MWSASQSRRIGMTEGLKPGWRRWRFEQMATKVNERVDDPSGVKGSDPNGANLRTDFLRISNLWQSYVAKPRDCRALREMSRAEAAPRAVSRSSFLPRKYLIGLNKRLKLAPFGSDPFIRASAPTAFSGQSISSASRTPTTPSPTRPASVALPIWTRSPATGRASPSRSTSRDRKPTPASPPTSAACARSGTTGSRTAAPFGSRWMRWSKPWTV